MDERGQFTFYASIFESAKRMKNKAARADFYDAVCDYALNGISPDLDKLADAAAVGFISVKPNLDASRKKAKSGKAGGSAKQTVSKPQANGKQTASEKEKEKEKEGEIEKEKEIENECYLSHNTEGTNTVDGIGAPPFDGRLFTEFWNKYPAGKGGDREEAWKAWKEISPSAATAGSIVYGLLIWIDSEQWQEDGGRYIPAASKFLRETRWISPPTAMVHAHETDSAFPETLAYARELMARKGEG